VVVLLHTAEQASFPDTNTHFIQFIQDAGLTPPKKQTVNGSNGLPLYELYYFE